MSRSSSTDRTTAGLSGHGSLGLESKAGSKKTASRTILASRRTSHRVDNVAHWQGSGFTNDSEGDSPTSFEFMIHGVIRASIAVFGTALSTHMRSGVWGGKGRM